MCTISNNRNDFDLIPIIVSIVNRVSLNAGMGWGICEVGINLYYHIYLAIRQSLALSRMTTDNTWTESYEILQYKMDLDFWDCFGRKKLSYNRRNTVFSSIGYSLLP